MEYILCSAIWFCDLTTQRNLPFNLNKGVVVCGWRHANIIATTNTLTGKRCVKNGENAIGDYVQGFITNKNKFVDRIEASEIAYNANQITENKKYLFSEDIW